jgi:bifunctional oligoribonuclease and PAP phosphatase NrnA
MTSASTKWTADYGRLEPGERERVLGEASALLKQARSVWIFTHEYPDGDALGSCLACYEMLRNHGVPAQVFCPDPIPRMYQALPHAEAVDASGVLPPGVPDVVLIVDDANWERLGAGLACQLAERGLGPQAAGRGQALGKIINLDHHIGNERFGDINLVDISAGACGELIYRLLQQIGAELTTTMAINLYAALSTDTGRFSYGNTSPDTLIIAQDLLAHGVEPHDVFNRVYSTRTIGQVQLLAAIIHTITPVEELGYFYCVASLAMLAETGTELSDTEGAVDIMKTVAGYETCFLFKEEEPRVIKASSRSNGGFDVNMFARRFGGGGHPAAAGFKLNCALAEAPGLVEVGMREVRALLGPPGRAGKELS